MSHQQGISRREFLRLSVIGAGAVALSACTGQAPEPTKAPAAATKAPEAAPTKAPEAAPTKAPEAAPTKAPEAAPTATPVPAAVATAAPAEGAGKTLVHAYYETNTLNPYIASELIGRATIAFMQRGLVGISKDGKWFPILAEELPSAENGGITDDGKTIAWKLKKDLKWSDGSPITSADIKFTWECCVNKDSTATQTQGFTEIESVDTPDEQTAVLHYKQVYAPWITQFGLGLLPKAAGAPENMGKWDWNRTGNPTNGPFMLKEWTPASHLIFVPNPNWFGSKPKLGQIILKIMPDHQTQLQAFKNGEVSFFEPYSEDMEIMKSVNATIDTCMSPYWYRVQFKLSENGDDRSAPPANPHPIFGDIRVRKAIRTAIDRDAIVFNWPAKHFSQSMFIQLPDLSCADADLPDYPKDVEAAKKMLDEAGWPVGADGIREAKGAMHAPDGTKMSFTVSTYSGWGEEDHEVVLVDQLKKLGMDPKIQNFEATVLYGTYGEGSPARQGKWDMMWWDYELGVDPQTKCEDFYASWRIPTKDKPDGFNCTRVNDPDIDKWIKEAGSTTDVATRKAAYCNIAKKLYNDIVNEIPVGVGELRQASQANVKGWQKNEQFMPYAVFGLDCENWDIEA